MNNDHVLYVEIIGEPFLKSAKAYREERIRTKSAWNEFAIKKGAEEYMPGAGLIFKNEIPKNWKVPKRNRVSVPKKGTVDEEELNALPKVPRSYLVFSGLILDTYEYATENGCKGWSSVGPVIGSSIGYTGDFVYAIIPDVARAAREHLEKHPDNIIDSKYLDYQVPEGLKLISKSKLDFEIAKRNLEYEEKKLQKENELENNNPKND